MADPTKAVLHICLPKIVYKFAHCLKFLDDFSIFKNILKT